MTDELIPATKGTGPLLQRDYWVVLEGCELRPSQVISFVREHFCELPPASLVEFVAASGLSLGVQLDILIKPGQHCAVRVIHESAQSITVGTLAGHPEAGRITFGSYRNPAGDVIFHIRSRARSSDSFRLVGFLALGEAMQTNTWADFIRNTAAGVGATIAAIHADTASVDEMPEDDEPLDSPTFLAVGD